MSTPVKYKIEYVNKNSNSIISDHKNKKLLVSKDIKLKVNDDGNLCATFKNSRLPKKSSLFDCFSEKFSDTDCSVIISDHSKFNHCIQKNGIYQLSGSDVAFYGTENADSLILKDCRNSKINMGKGDDTVLYREYELYNNEINLGEGNNVFAAKFQSDADKPLEKNKIISEKGNNYIYLRNANNNEIFTGEGNDLVEIEGAPRTGLLNRFENNLICTEEGNDTVNIFGDFGKFFNNKFYLGEGSDNFCAEINSKNDVKTEGEYYNKVCDYTNAVINNEIYATEGEKGLFEKNVFESKTFSANQFNKYLNTSALSEGFQKEIIKPVPKTELTVSSEDDTDKSKKLTREYFSARYNAGSLGWNLFRDPKMLENAFKALDEYVEWMAKGQ